MFQPRLKPTEQLLKLVTENPLQKVLRYQDANEIISPGPPAISSNAALMVDHQPLRMQTVAKT